MSDIINIVMHPGYCVNDIKEIVEFIQKLIDKKLYLTSRFDTDVDLFNKTLHKE